MDAGRSKTKSQGVKSCLFQKAVEKAGLRDVPFHGEALSTFVD
jgi:hypothetical protein